MGVKLFNFLSTLIGVNGVPLYYVVRGKYNPDANREFPTFIDKTIACAPLKRDKYEAGHHTVHQARVSFTPGHQ